MTKKPATRNNREMLELLQQYKDEFHIKSTYFDQMIVEFERKVASAKTG